MSKMKGFFSKKSRDILVILLALSNVISIIFLSGCNGNNQAIVYDSKSPAISVESSVLATNSNYELVWNDDLKCVLLKSLTTGEIWSNIPYEYQLSGGSSANVNSTLNITVSNQETMEWAPIRGYIDAYQKGRIFSERIDNGIKVTYCFDNYEISVPVEYVLRDDSVEISIDPNGIVEGGTKFLLVSVSVAPFMCSARNAAEGSYMFIPVGSGSLMYAKELLGTERSWSGEVYGSDGARNIPRSLYDDEKITMPIFGAKDADRSMLAIIESGAGAAVIEAEAGNPRTGYSTVYPTFYMRGYDVFEQTEKSDLKRVSDSISPERVSVGYYPLNSGDGYVEMANKYRDYLSKTNAAASSKASASPYAVNLLGGVTVTSSFAGIPVKKLKSMTTFSEAQSILEQLYEGTGVAPNVMLSGFGDGGITLGKLGGGFNISNASGGKKQLKAFLSYCDENSVNAFFDYDIVRYNSSGNGFSYINDTAETALLKKAEGYFSAGAFRAFSDDWSYRLIKRSMLSKAVDKVIKSSEKLSFDNISLSTLSGMAYSDYSNELYYTKGNIEKDVSGLLKSIQDSGKKISGSAANSYAAALMDVVFDAPADNGSYDTLDDRIPFYQMVFGADRPLYTTAVNIASEPQKLVMLAASSGMGLGFTLIGNYDVSFDEAQAAKLYGMLFDDNIKLINSLVSDYSELYNAVTGSRITKYEIADNGISKTVFDNGVTVFANHNSREAKCEIGTLEAYGYSAVY